MKRVKVKVSPGDAWKLGRSPNTPIVQLAGRGKDIYLWIGNDAKGDMACWGYTSTDLRALANEILRCLGPEAKR